MHTCYKSNCIQPHFHSFSRIKDSPSVSMSWTTYASLYFSITHFFSSGQILATVKESWSRHQFRKLYVVEVEVCGSSRVVEEHLRWRQEKVLFHDDVSVYTCPANKSIDIKQYKNITSIHTDLVNRETYNWSIHSV